MRILKEPGLLLGVIVFTSSSYGQALLSPRAIGLAAYDPMVSDTREFSANPAGLTGVRDWEFYASTYMNPRATADGFVFHGFGLGKRISDADVLAVQYTPGTSLQFIVPPRFFGTDSTSGSNDQEILYEEKLAFGAGHRFTDNFSAGLSVRIREETVIDREYTLIFPDSLSLPVGFSDTAVTFSKTTWNVDLGLQWQPDPRVTLSAVGRNLVRISAGGFPAEFDSLALPRTRLVEAGLAFAPSSSFTAAIQIGSNRTAALGYEWKPWKSVSFGNGLYFSDHQSPVLFALSARAGWSYEVFELEASYLRFLNQDARRGTTSFSGFSPENISAIDLSPYTADRLSLSAKVIFGSIRQPLVRIEGVRMAGGIYPSSYQTLAYRPIGTVLVKNISDKPVQAKASFFVDRFMDAPTESRPVYMSPGEEREIPLNAVFNELLLRVASGTIRDGNVYVTATPAEDYDDRAQARVYIHGRNEWDGDVHTLRYFVTPDDPEVLRYSRDVLLRLRDSLSAVPRQLENFVKARLIFNEFAGKLLYVGDPKQSADFVQYPSETLKAFSGDCDDMTVSFASLLSSVGISTAFVDVIPPDRPEKSHIYLLFDTGVPPQFGNSVSQNPKRYILRKNIAGVESIWIPIETTAIASGFEDAWTRGAQEYFDDVELGLGLAKGWVRIVDVN